MVRRVFVALLLVIAFSAVALPAQADTARTQFKGRFAFAEWNNAQTGTFAVVEVAADIDELLVILETETRDAGGNVTGFTIIDTDTNLSPHGTFTMDARHLTTATLNASGLPTETCQYDANFDLIGCADTETDVSVTWTGIGQATRTNSIIHEEEPGFVTTTVFHGLGRNALAAGSIDGTTLSADDLTDASLAVRTSGTVTVCTGSC